MFYAGKARINKVGKVLRQDAAQAVRSYKARSDRIISIRLLGKPNDIIINQILAPTTGAKKMKLKGCMQVSKKKFITYQNKTC